MINVLITGVGGQGTVLASRLLAVAAQAKGWKVRTAETIGMAQRGGSVVSHVRIGNLGETINSPLIMHGTANMIIAFEPGEAARVLSYLSPTGLMVTATTPVQPVTSALGDEPYNVNEILDGIQLSLYNSVAKNISRSRGLAGKQLGLVVIDDKAITHKLGGNRKVLNTIMLAAALSQNRIGISVDDLRNAVRECVKPQFIDMNMQAIDATLGGNKKYANQA